MIYIEATGSNKKIRDEVEKACEYFIQRLMPRLKNLDITIELIRKLKEKDVKIHQVIFINLILHEVIL